MVILAGSVNGFLGKMAFSSGILAPKGFAGSNLAAIPLFFPQSEIRDPKLNLGPPGFEPGTKGL